LTPPADAFYMSTDMAAGEESSYEDKRKSPRKNVMIPCALTIDGIVYPGRLLDISSEGAFVQSEQAVSYGAQLLIVFKAPLVSHRVYLRLDAIVVHVGRFLRDYNSFYGFGARFTGISPNTMARLKKVIESLHADPQRKYEFM
jgi:hypothetical protein